MLIHLIQHKGKGFLVFILPLIIGFVLFIIFDALNLNDEYVFPVALLLSAFSIWIYDKGPDVLREGFKNVEKSKHVLMWIEIKYWAIALGILGCVLLGKLLEK